MDYERIHKVQTGLISPSKLRMKLIGPHNKEASSNSNSARTSPSKLHVDDDSEFVRSSLLADVDNQELASGDLPPPSASTSLPKEGSRYSKLDSGNNSNAIHPIRIFEDENNLDYDSNASSSSFEFHKGERSNIARSFSRPIPSKWNDAEKWIVNKHSNHSKKIALHNQTNRLFPQTNMVRVVPEYAGFDHKLSMSMARVPDTKMVDSCQPVSQNGFERFSFVPHQGYGGNALVDSCAQSKDELSRPKSSAEDDASAVPAIRSVCMRDMGTEMTPVASQEPSRTATPVGATTPLRSPTSSIPSTPRGDVPTSTPIDHTTDDESRHQVENITRDLTEQEMKEKTRREIVALGVQLGKMNIAAWASKEDHDSKNPSAETDMEELERIENEKRAAAWEEAEKTKHNARFKREEIQIQAWESQQKAKLEAEMRRIEAKVEQMRAQAQAKKVKKIAMARQRSEEKRAAAEARKSREAERTAAQVEYIRQTGRMPSSQYFTCCGWLS